MAPAGGEAVIDKRHYRAFRATDLDTQLGRAGMGGLVICGVQTEVCVDTTCRAAAALGYDVTLVSDAHTTYDSGVLLADKVIAHHNETLRNRFAKLGSAAEIGF